MKHRGEIIEKIIREKGYPIAGVARRLGKSRRHLYNIFENDHVPFDVITEIGRIINYDFSKDFKELVPDELTNMAIENLPDYFNSEAEELEYYRRELERISQRYIRLLEKHNELLNEKLTSPKK